MAKIRPDYASIRERKSILSGEYVGFQWRSDWCADCGMEKQAADWGCVQCCGGVDSRSKLYEMANALLGKKRRTK